MARRQLVARGRSPPQAGAAGEGRQLLIRGHVPESQPPCGSWGPRCGTSSLAQSPELPAHPCCPGWVGPAPWSDGSLLPELPPAGTQGLPLPRFSTHPKPPGEVQGELMYPWPRARLGLALGMRFPGVGQAAPSRSPGCARRPTAGELVTSLSAHRLS